MASYYRVRKQGEVLPVAETDVTFFDVEISFSTAQVDAWAADDIVHLIGPFPKGAKVVLDYADEGGATTPEAGTTEWSYDFSDLDTHATPTLDFDIGFSAALTGTSLDVFANDSAAAQTGATDYNDASEIGTDIGEKYLVLKIVTAAATAAGGTVRVRGAYSIQPRRIYIDATGAVAVTI